MPGFSGGDAIEIAREQCPEVPIVFLSGTLGEELAIELLTRGEWDYVLKDRPGRLVPAVKRALQLAAALRERRSLDDFRQHANRVLSAHNHVLESIASGVPLLSTLEVLVGETEGLLPGCSVGLLLHRDEGEGSQLSVGPNLPPVFLPIRRDIWQHEDRKPQDLSEPASDVVAVPSLAADVRWSGLTELADALCLSGYWSLPIWAPHGRTRLGSLVVFHGAAGAPTPEELEVARESIRLVSVAVERDRVSARAAYRDLHEPVTALVVSRAPESTGSRHDALRLAFLAALVESSDDRDHR